MDTTAFALESPHAVWPFILVIVTVALFAVSLIWVQFFDAPVTLLTGMMAAAFAAMFISGAVILVENDRPVDTPLGVRLTGNQIDHIRDVGSGDREMYSVTVKKDGKPHKFTFHKNGKGDDVGVVIADVSK